MKRSSLPSPGVLQVSLEYLCDQEEAYVGPQWGLFLGCGPERGGLDSTADRVACPLIVAAPKTQVSCWAPRHAGGDFVHLKTALMVLKRYA